jgi:uncharacterized protein YecT (DUF1311 family)
MKKRFIPFSVLFLIIISGCIVSPKKIIRVSVEVTRKVSEEVTRLIILTPIPTKIPAPTKSCYDEAKTQDDLNQCSGLLAEEARKMMNEIVELIKNKYSNKPEKVQEFSRLQSEWENHAFEECKLWYGSYIKDPNTGNEYYENGSMAPMLFGECLQYKYENRAMELKWLLDF